MLQSFRSHSRDRRFFAVVPARWCAFCVAFCAASCLAFCLSAPPLFAEDSAASPTSGDAQLRLAEQQGDAETAVLDWVLNNSGPLKGDTRAGAMRMAFTITPAEGWWDKAGEGKLAWHEPPAGNVHLRIFVLDLADGRLVPSLNLRATLTDAHGNEQSVPSDFGWYPLINAYGGNVPIAADSSYTLRVAIDGPVPHGVHSEHAAAEFPPVAIVLDEVSQIPLATANAAAHEAELLVPCNAALTAAITALWQHSITGAEKPDDNYFVGYALDFSGPALPLGGAKLHLKSLAGKDDVRVELLARDSRTGRIIPGLKPQATLTDTDGESYGPGELSLAFYPLLTHYAGSARIPRKGLYTLHAHFDAPGYRRWGKQSERFATPGDVEFDGVSLKPGKKE